MTVRPGTNPVSEVRIEFGDARRTMADAWLSAKSRHDGAMTVSHARQSTGWTRTARPCLRIPITSRTNLASRAPAETQEPTGPFPF